MKYKTKLFLHNVVTRRAPGAAPDEWATVKIDRPIDEQINEWVDRSGAVLVSVPSPSFHVQWVDKEMTTRSILTAVMVTYTKEENGEHADVWPEHPDPAAPTAPAPGGAQGP